VILYSALVVSVVFASGTFLLLQRDLTRVVVGILLVSNSAVLFIISSRLTRDAAPIYPLGETGPVSDPLVQAMALTALIIGFGVAALLLAMIYRLYVSHSTVDLEEIADAEMREAEALERVDDPEREQVPDEEQDAEPEEGTERRPEGLGAR
jgi:multicomponent Na+:H+ antiporter subunit C